MEGMDAFPRLWYFSAMSLRTEIPAFQLYGEALAFPDILHMEQIRDRAAGLDWIIRPHRHTHLFQIFLLNSGKITFNSDGIVTTLSPPVALCLPPHAVHGFCFSSDTEGWVISLPVQHYPDFFDEGAELARTLLAPKALAPPEDMADRVDALCQVWRGKTRFRRTELRCQIGLILTSLAQADPGSAPRSGDPRISRFQALIAAHARDHWPIGQYAQALGLSERSLGRLCRAQTGLSPQAVIEAHLMREASRLLAYTQMSAQSVAHALGFDDPSYFSRRFRAFAGMSPRAYRKRLDPP